MGERGIGLKVKKEKEMGVPELEVFIFCGIAWLVPGWVVGQG